MQCHPEKNNFLGFGFLKILLKFKYVLPRIIPCLLISDGGLAKTQKFTSKKYVGDLINAFVF